MECAQCQGNATCHWSLLYLVTERESCGFDGFLGLGVGITDLLVAG